MRTAIERVTPDRARELLAKNTRNRPLRKGVVNKIARDIASGRWHVHHQGIGLAPSFVVDGQHRLHAIVQADAAVEVNVTVYETDEEGEQGLLVVDKNATRSDADVQSIAGVMSRETARVCVPIVRLLCVHGVFGKSVSSLSTDEISSFYLAEKEHVDWSVAITDPEAKTRFTAVHRAALAAGHAVDPRAMERFASEIVAFDESAGKVASAWVKAEAQKKLTQTSKGGRGTRDCLYMCLRLVQAALEQSEPPKILRAHVSTLEWMRDKIVEVRTGIASDAVDAAAE